jgi:hypothetical protein
MSYTWCCKDCKFGEWPLSRNGRRLFAFAGKCLYEIDRPKLPECIANTHFEKTYIDKNMGTVCECFCASSRVKGLLIK